MRFGKNFLQVVFQLYYKFGTEYKKFYIDFEVDWCKVVSGDVPPKYKTYVNIIIHAVYRVYPQYIHKCPYHVRIGIICNYHLENIIRILMQLSGSL